MAINTFSGGNFINSLQAAGKNAIINGGMDIWQRGTSFTSVGYTADRWYGVWTGTVTLTRQTSGAPIGSQYYLRQVSGANGSIIDLIQFIETANVVPMQGKPVTLSFKVRRNASLLSDFQYFIQKSATVDAGAGASWTTVQTGSFANASIPTGTTINDWYSASASFTIPTDGTANSIRIVLEPSSQMPINSSFDLAQVQLELGTTATTFSRAGGTIQGELANCQRYYQRWTGTSGNGVFLGFGNAASTASCYPLIQGLQLRTLPTSVDYANVQASDTGAGITVTSINIWAGEGKTVLLQVNAAAASYTISRGYYISLSSTSAYVGLSAEL